MQLCAYVYDARHVIVDLGPGSGILNRTAIMSSHGFYLPLTAESKSVAVIRSLASCLPAWLQQYEALRSRTNRHADNPYKLPNHTPKFLGVVFTRIGGTGAVRKINLWTVLMRANSCIHQPDANAAPLQHGPPQRAL